MCEETRFDENSYCGVGRGQFRMPNRECLEPAGDLARTQDSIRFLVFVLVKANLGYPIGSVWSLPAIR